MKWKANLSNSLSIIALINEDYGLALKSLEIASGLCEKINNEDDDPELL
jgi:hypothetical protein